MDISQLANEFFAVIDKTLGPFDKPLQFRLFPFDAGGNLNILNAGAGTKQFVLYVSWDLYGQEQLKQGSLGRYELLSSCDDENWCVEILTNVGRLCLQEIFDPGDTLDIGPWVGQEAALQGVLFEEAFRTNIGGQECGLLRCIGVTKQELDFAVKNGVPSLINRLKRAGIYPHTTSNRKSVDLK
jgi:hypothetical protein